MIESNKVSRGKSCSSSVTLTFSNKFSPRKKINLLPRVKPALATKKGYAQFSPQFFLDVCGFEASFWNESILTTMSHMVSMINTLVAWRIILCLYQNIRQILLNKFSQWCRGCWIRLSWLSFLSSFSMLKHILYISSILKHFKHFLRNLGNFRAMLCLPGGLLVSVRHLKTQDNIWKTCFGMNFAIFMQFI